MGIEGKMKFLERLKLFLTIFKYLLTGKADFHQYKDTKIDFGKPGLQAQMSIKNMDTGKWEIHLVTFDGKKAIGYINGIDVTSKDMSVFPKSTMHLENCDPYKCRCEEHF